MTAFIFNDFSDTCWAVIAETDGEYRENYTAATLEDAIAYCKRNGLEYSIGDWRDAFVPEGKYASNSYRDELEYLYEV